MHWCADEQLALITFLAMIPFLGPWLRSRINRFRGRHCCEPDHKKEA